MKTSPSEKNAVVFFHSFMATLGGSEYLPLLLIAELQQRGYSVTLALTWKADLEQVARRYQIDIDTQNVKVIAIGPKNALVRRMDLVLPFYKTRKIKSLAKNADICFSLSNTIDFGKSAHHVIVQLHHFQDSAFWIFISRKKTPSVFFRIKRKFRFIVSEFFFRPLLRVRSTRKIIVDKREHIYVPSQYVADAMQAFYGPFNCTVFYPPTIFTAPSLVVKRDPLRVIYLGRIMKEKGITDIIDVVEKARQLSSLPLEFHIAGRLDNDPYSKNLQSIALEKPWIKFVGLVYGEKKAAFLLSGSYAIHAERDEAFGISITEYLKAGCIPIVPDEGGTPEVVDDPALTYHTDEDAARILVHLLNDEAFRRERLEHCKKRAKEFSFERYLETQHRILDGILGKQA